MPPMPLDQAVWHKPGKTNLFLTLYGPNRRRWVRLRLFCRHAWRRWLWGAAL